MKRSALWVILSLSLLLIVISSLYSGLFSYFTGGVVSNDNSMVGPSASEQSCIKACVSIGCSEGDMSCMKKNSASCLSKCNVVKPEVTSETSCMESCVVVGCSEYDFSCQNNNKAKCESECGMIKEPEAKSEEEQCIRDCVNSHSPGTICQAGEGGEKGGSVCQMCASQCVHLYAGPCLNEEKLEQKKSDCKTCDNCYGSPIMGDSGEGYQCIVDVSCQDSSLEFGDNPGEGEGIIANVGEAIGDFFGGIGKFFKGLFGGGESKSNELVSSE